MRKLLLLIPLLTLRQVFCAPRLPNRVLFSAWSRIKAEPWFPAPK